jgi:hypothetical protein
MRLPLLARALLFAAIAVAAPASPASAAGRDGASSQGTPKPHQHSWVKQSRKDWVPPETRRVQVGVDAKGRPIYETQIVKPGYWKTTTWFVCSCGATKG